MPITVVTHRDDVGAPTNREVYAVGALYRLGPTGLEILDANRRILALYPDGNWLSVYRDNSVRVVTEGRPEEEPVPRSAAAPEPAAPEPAAPEGGPGAPISEPDEPDTELAARVAEPDIERAAPDIEPASPVGDDTVLVPDEILDAEPATADVPDFGDEPAASAPTTIDADTIEPDAAEPDVPERDAPEPVATADDTAEAERPSATPERTSSVPPGMRAVKFRPRVIRPAPRPEEPSRPSHMRPLVFRAKTYRKPDK